MIVARRQGTKHCFDTSSKLDYALLTAENVISRILQRMVFTCPVYLLFAHDICPDPAKSLRHALIQGRKQIKSSVQTRSRETTLDP